MGVGKQGGWSSIFTSISTITPSLLPPSTVTHVITQVFVDGQG